MLTKINEVIMLAIPRTYQSALRVRKRSIQYRLQYSTRLDTRERSIHSPLVMIFTRYLSYTSIYSDMGESSRARDRILAMLRGLCVPPRSPRTPELVRLPFVSAPPRSFLVSRQRVGERSMSGTQFGERLCPAAMPIT